jgi:hypothetical protein
MVVVHRHIIDRLIAFLKDLQVPLGICARKGEEKRKRPFQCCRSTHFIAFDTSFARMP